MPFTAKHEITKRLVTPALFHRHFFRIEDRPQEAMVIYIDLVDENGKEYMKYRVEIRSIKKDEFKKYKDQKFFGNFWIDTDPVVKLPKRYKFLVKWGLITKREAIGLVEASGKYEDLTTIDSLEKLIQKHSKE